MGISIALKSYNLIFLFPILIFFYSLNSSKTKKIKYFFCFLLILFPLFLLNFLTHKYLGFIFSPANEDLKIAIIGGAGFVGNSLSKRLDKQNIDNMVFDRQSGKSSHIYIDVTKKKFVRLN